MTSRFEVLRRRLTAPLAIDVAIALVCLLATVAVPVKAVDSAGPGLFLFAGVASVPLVWRRRWPVAVAAAVGAGSVGLVVTGAQGFIPLPYGQLVATYTVAALSPPLWRLLVMAVTGGVTVAVLVADLGVRPSIVAPAVLPFVVAYAMGTGARARRDRIAMLEERSGRLIEEREAAAVRERERIAREIHDIVAHSVSLMVVQAEAGAVLADDRPRARAAFDAISETGREAVAQLDRALGVLRGDGPAARRPVPGLGDLPDLVEQTRSAGLTARLDVRGSPLAVSPELATAVYRVVQEALTNAIRHAQASMVCVELEWGSSALRVEVVDNGRGASAGATASGGRGLVGMGERVRAFGGSLDAGVPRDTGGTGFRVTATLPVPSTGDGHG